MTAQSESCWIYRHSHRTEQSQSMETGQTHRITQVVQECTLPTITKAVVGSEKSTQNETFITVSWKRNVYEISESNKFSTLYKYEDGSNPSLKAIATFPILHADVILEAVSPSSTLRATIKKVSNPDTKKNEYVLQIWSKSGTKLQTTMNLSSYDKHGQVHADETFGSLQWSDDETRLVYVAEKKKEKSIGFFTRVPSDDDQAKQPERGIKYNYEESWGELLTDVTNTVICVVDISKETLEIVKGIPEGVCPAQPQWGPKNSLIFEGIQQEPFRLGRIYCENRVSAIYQITLGDGESVLSLTNELLSTSYSPRLNKCKTKVIFLQKILSGHGDPHRSAETLMLYDFEQKVLSRVYSVKTFQEKPVELYCHQLPKNCWLEDDVHIALPITYQASQYACVINILTGELHSMTGCTSVLGVYANLILTSHMKLESQSALLQVIKFQLPSVSIIREIGTNVDNIKYGRITNDHGIISHYIIPSSSEIKLLPLVVAVHGGPHTVYTDDYNRDARMFCKLGYAVLLVNYRGSTSFSTESLKSLLGNVGTQDIEETQNFVLQFIDSMGGKIDMKNIFITGGSHGGFITTHLIGQYPTFYRAAATRNPVIDIASMTLSSDIPDWTYVESGLSYTQDILPTGGAYQSMLEKSPIIHLKNVNAPVLLCIGGKDARVPPSQGKAYYRLLKANNKVAKLLYYPEDSHPLSGVETDGDNIVNICKWFYMHHCGSKEN